MNIKKKRLEKMMTQEEVAHACGLTQSSYSHYEIGRRNPKPVTLKKIAEVLDCTVDALLEDSDADKDLKGEE